MSEKEQYLNVIAEGENLGVAANNQHNIQKKVTAVINSLTTQNTSDTIKQLIECCMVAQVVSLTLLEALDLKEDLQRKNYQYFIMGYQKGKTKEHF